MNSKSVKRDNAEQSKVDDRKCKKTKGKQIQKQKQQKQNQSSSDIVPIFDKEIQNSILFVYDVIIVLGEIPLRVLNPKSNIVDNGQTADLSRPVPFLRLF